MSSTEKCSKDIFQITCFSLTKYIRNGRMLSAFERTFVFFFFLFKNQKKNTDKNLYSVEKVIFRMQESSENVCTDRSQRKNEIESWKKNRTREIVESIWIYISWSVNDVCESIFNYCLSFAVFNAGVFFFFSSFWVWNMFLILVFVSGHLYEIFFRMESREMHYLHLFTPFSLFFSPGWNCTVSEKSLYILY